MTRPPGYLLTAILATTLTCQISVGQSFMDDFTTDTLSSDYVGDSSPPEFVWSATAGVGGGGGVVPPGNGNIIFRSQPEYDFSLKGTTMSTSFDFFWDQDIATGAKKQMAMIGFRASPSGFFSDGNRAVGGLEYNKNQNKFYWKAFASGLSFADGSDGNQNFDASVTSQQWYRIAFNGEITATDNIQYTTSLYGLGASGADAPTLLDDIVATSTNTALSSDTTWHSLFKVRGDRGVAAIDNLNASMVESTTFTALYIDRETGNMTLSNTDDALDFKGYTITSSFEKTLSPTNWLSIADNYDSDSGGSVDSTNTWTVDASFTDELTESTTGSATFANMQAIDLGSAWTPWPFEDIEASLVLADDTTLTIPVRFTGNGGESFAIGDLNTDGSVDATDWSIFKAGQGADLSGMAFVESYTHGDFDDDQDNDAADFLLFKSYYDQANGAGAFAAMVPEPHSFCLLALGCIPFLLFRRRNR